MRLLLAALFLFVHCAHAQIVRVDVPAPGAPHIVLFDPVKADSKLLLWMPGTFGKPRLGRDLNFPQFAAQQGYRVVMLSYITDQAVSSICVGKTIVNNRPCAADFRQKRVFGTGAFALIPDQPQDAITHRLGKLLQELAATRKAEQWDQFLLPDGSPRWERIAVSGQSQGGGHAAYIGKAKLVERVIMFSGGWDMSAHGELADWYANPSATPPARWFAAFHVDEPAADRMAEIARILKIPAANIRPLALPVQGAKAHGEGMSNPAYQTWWTYVLK